MRKSVNKEKILEILRKEQSYLYEKYGIEKMAIYGSFAKGHPKNKSDVDILVKLKKPLGLEFFGLTYYLEDKLGREVDLATFKTFQRSIKDPRYKAIAANIEKTLTYV